MKKPAPFASMRRIVIFGLVGLLIACQIPASVFADELQIEKPYTANEVNSSQMPTACDSSPVSSLNQEETDLVDSQESDVNPSVENGIQNDLTSIVNDEDILCDAEEKTINLSLRMIGPDAAGNMVEWATCPSYSALEGQTVEDATRDLLMQANLNADIQVNAQGKASLNSIVSPYDGKTYKWDSPEKEHFWCLLINGQPALQGMSDVVLSEHDDIVWMYCAYEDEIPKDEDLTENPLVVNPNASRPHFDADWAGFAGGSTLGGSITEASTPTSATDVELPWNPLVFSGEGGTSDQLIVNNKIYLVHGSHLYIVNASNGVIEKTAEILVPMRYFCRIAYADGLILVPLETGQIQAFTADTLTCAWISQKPNESKELNETQALSSIVVNKDKVFCAFTDCSNTGLRICVNLNNGELLWSKIASQNQYYWCGAASFNENFVIASETGDVCLIDGTNGNILSSITLSRRCRSTVIAIGNNRFAVNANGLLNILEISNGQLVLADSYEFAKFSSSTPAVVDGLVFVGGTNGWQKELMAVINTNKSASDSSSICVTTVQGEPKSAILVSKQNDTYRAYFTCNAKPGSAQLITYRNGTLSAAELLFNPDEQYQEFSTGSIIADSCGTLYYTNDSGILFALRNRKAGSNSDGLPQPNPDEQNDKPLNETAVSQGTTEDNSISQNLKTVFRRSIKPISNNTSTTVDDKTASLSNDASAIKDNHVDNNQCNVTDNMIAQEHIWPKILIGIGSVGLICIAGTLLKAKHIHQ